MPFLSFYCCFSVKHILPYHSCTSIYLSKCNSAISFSRKLHLTPLSPLNSDSFPFYAIPILVYGIIQHTCSQKHFSMSASLTISPHLLQELSLLSPQLFSIHKNRFPTGDIYFKTLSSNIAGPGLGQSDSTSQEIGIRIRKLVSVWLRTVSFKSKAGQGGAYSTICTKKRRKQ